jgi:hypothetical protein
LSGAENRRYDACANSLYTDARPILSVLAMSEGYGRQLGVGWSERWMLLHVYQVEGNAFVAGARAEVDAMRFQQSLYLT